MTQDRQEPPSAVGELVDALKRGEDPEEALARAQRALEDAEAACTALEGELGFFRALLARAGITFVIAAAVVGCAPTDALPVDTTAMNPPPAPAHVSVRDTSIAVTLVSKRLVPADPSAFEYNDRIALHLRYENRSGRDVRAFRGVLTFTDLFGDVVYAASLTRDSRLRAGARIDDRTRSIEVNPYEDEVVRLSRIPLSDLAVTWNATDIIYADSNLPAPRPRAARPQPPPVPPYRVLYTQGHQHIVYVPDSALGGAANFEVIGRHVCRDKPSGCEAYVWTDMLRTPHRYPYQQSELTRARYKYVKP